MDNSSEANSGHDFAQAHREAAAFLLTLRQPYPRASVSFKSHRTDFFGDGRADITVITEQTQAVCWFADIDRALKLDQMSPEGERYLLQANRAELDGVEPTSEIFLHAALPARVVIYALGEGILALCSTPSGMEKLAAVLPGVVLQAPFASGMREQARVASETWKPGAWAVVLPHRGLLVGGDTLEMARERLGKIYQAAEEVLKSSSAWETINPIERGGEMDLCAAAELRKQFSQQAGHPVVVRWAKNAAPAQQRCFLPGVPYLHASHVVRDEKLGTGFIGDDPAETTTALNAYTIESRIIQRVSKLGPVDWLDGSAIATAETASLKTAATGIMRGEVALVTGAASGIGKACVFSFLARGSAVVGLDVNPAVTTMLARPDYLGIACDLTDEDAIRVALAQVVSTFGGLDMMVLNAGIFPSSKRIDSLSFADFDRVLRINLSANLNLMREAHPLLKNAPNGGRVVANASRNALAPGPGAAAYSVSKMALTQLARVAALEWGDDHIRINVVHPDSVFDTGVWSEEVLKTRAANYHMTVDEYKRRNVMKTELTSKDVSEMIVEMCGPLFSKVTGAQLPVDGGNDRVI